MVCCTTADNSTIVSAHLCITMNADDMGTDIFAEPGHKVPCGYKLLVRYYAPSGIFGTARRRPRVHAIEYCISGMVSLFKTISVYFPLFIPHHGKSSIILSSTYETYTYIQDYFHGNPMFSIQFRTGQEMIAVPSEIVSRALFCPSLRPKVAGSFHLDDTAHELLMSFLPGRSQKIKAEPRISRLTPTDLLRLLASVRRERVDTRTTRANHHPTLACIWLGSIH